LIGTPRWRLGITEAADRDVVEDARAWRAALEDLHELANELGHAETVTSLDGDVSSGTKRRRPRD
jgi:hypothetical protein